MEMGIEALNITSDPCERKGLLALLRQVMSERLHESICASNSNSLADSG